MQKLNNKKVKILVLIILAFISYSTYNFIKTALAEDDVKIIDKPQSTHEQEEKPVRVYLTVNYLGNKTSYSKRMQNTNSVLDLFELLRAEEGFAYEKIAYTYGTEIENINNIPAPEGYKWKVFMTSDRQSVDDLNSNILLPDGEYELLLKTTQEPTDITYNIAELNLVEGAQYEIELIRTSALQ